MRFRIKRTIYMPFSCRIYCINKSESGYFPSDHHHYCRSMTRSCVSWYSIHKQDLSHWPLLSTLNSYQYVFVCIIAIYKRRSNDQRQQQLMPHDHCNCIWLRCSGNGSDECNKYKRYLSSYFQLTMNSNCCVMIVVFSISRTFTRKTPQSFPLVLRLLRSLSLSRSVAVNQMHFC